MELDVAERSRPAEKARDEEEHGIGSTLRSFSWERSTAVKSAMEKMRRRIIGALPG